MDAKILTRHPQGKNGKNIPRADYDLFKQAILSALEGKELTHAELFDQLNRDLKGKVPGNINWYAETVKLDLEARKRIKRSSARPLKYQLK